MDGGVSVSIYNDCIKVLLRNCITCYKGWSFSREVHIRIPEVLHEIFLVFSLSQSVFVFVASKQSSATGNYFQGGGDNAGASPP